MGQAFMIQTAAFLLLILCSDAFAQIRFTETGGGTDYVGIQSPTTVGADVVWTLPSVDGSANQCLVTSGAGVLSWRSCSAGNAFSLSANDGSPLNAVYVDAGGRVGMGTTVPTTGTILDLTGSATTNSSVILPRDTTANRPTGVNGMLRYNSTTNSFEGYQDGDWSNIGNGFVGKLEIAPATNCRWPNGAGNAYASHAADMDCGAVTVTGAVSAPATKIPGVVLNNLPAGDYEVTVNANFTLVTASNQCRWRLTDGTNTSGIAHTNSNADNHGMLRGIFSYTATGNRTIEVQSVNMNSTANVCFIENNLTNMRFEILVKRL